MTCFRVSIGRVMLAVALIGFHLAVVEGRCPVFGLDGLEVGLLPGVTVLAIGLIPARRRNRSGPFRLGFLASLAVSIGLYLALCLTIPGRVERPIVFYINEVEPFLFDADLMVTYWLCREIHGAILGLPQLLVALVGGWVSAGVAAAPSRRRARPTLRTPSVGAFLLLFLVSVVGCSRSDSSRADRAEPAGPLVVAAASDLMDALPELIRVFSRQPDGSEVRASFGSSGQLAEQIKAGAPFDLFLAANETYVNDLATEHYIDRGSIHPYAVGSLVLAVHPAAAGAVKDLAAIDRPDVKRVAIANPDFAPYGIAAKQALTRAGLWERVAPKVVMAETVRQAFQFVQSGNAEAGLVGKAQAREGGVETIDVAPELYDPIVQGLGVVSRSSRGRRADAFARFLLSPAGQAVLASHGFKPPPARSGHVSP